MGFIDRYRKFSELTVDEVREQFREQAAEQRRLDLEKVEVLDLSTTTPEEMPHPAVAAAISFAGKRALNRAGDPLSGELRDLLATYSGVGSSPVAVGAGATGLIGALALAALEPGDSLLTPWPSYPLYPLAAAAAGAEAVPLGPDRDPEALVAAVRDNPNARILMLCNPNDPDGSLTSVGDLERLRELLPERVLLVVDEALADYAGEDHMKATSRLAAESDGIILIRSLSKAWGLAGLRVGWMIGGDDSRELFARLSPLLGVSGPSEAGAIAVLRDAPETATRRAKQVRSEAERLEKLLRGTPVELHTGAANFAWLRLPGTSGAELAASLRGSGLQVLDGAEVGADQHVRAAIRGDGAATDRLAEGLHAAVAQASADSGTESPDGEPTAG